MLVQHEEMLISTSHCWIMILSQKRGRVDNDSGILPLATPKLRGCSLATHDDRRRKPTDGCGPESNSAILKGGVGPHVRQRVRELLLSLQPHSPITEGARSTRRPSPFFLTAATLCPRRRTV